MPTEREPELPSLCGSRARLQEALCDAEAALGRVFAEINGSLFRFDSKRGQRRTRQLREEAAVLLARIRVLLEDES
jgi:hypothetical protein